MPTRRTPARRLVSLTALVLAVVASLLGPVAAADARVDGPPSTTVVLNDVSCASARACFAVGVPPYATSGDTDDDYRDESRPAVVRWDGTRWAETDFPVLPVVGGRPLAGRLTRVSCGFDRAGLRCLALGEYYVVRGMFRDDTSYGRLTAVYTGGSWRLAEGPSDCGGYDINPCDRTDEVDCVAPIACYGLGVRYNAHYRAVSVFWSWNGSTWSHQRVPAPERGGYGHSACTGVRRCVLTGSVATYHPRRDIDQLLTTLDDGTWHPTRLPGGVAQSALSEIDCVGRTFCAAARLAGDAGDRTLTRPSVLVRDRDSIWRRLPVSRSLDPVADLSCGAPRSCLAVGDDPDRDGATTAAVIGHTVGQAAAPPLPTTQLDCATTRFCVAVATAGGSDGEGLLEVWDGRSWSAPAVSVRPYSGVSGARAAR